jgi:methionyl-tRNA formyltransferase
MGTPAFALPTLRALTERHDVVGVYTRPDAVSGRGSRAKPSDVAAYALQHELDLHRPGTLRDPAVLSQLGALHPDVLVVAAYGLLLPREVLAVAPHGAINVHASLLPRWRGAAPIQRAILEGDEVTGVSIMRMEEGLDTGPYCSQDEVAIDDLDAERLGALLACLGADALIGALDALETGSCAWTEQDEALATYAAKITKADVAIDSTLSLDRALRHVRASTRQAPIRISLSTSELTVLAATRSELDVAPGAAILDTQGVHLGVADGALLVTALKPSGRGEMNAAAWGRGARIASPATWDRLR